jgi:cob(I)alamin adenosyltransferase
MGRRRCSGQVGCEERHTHSPPRDVDQASASFGLIRAEADDKEIKELLLELQRLLYQVVGAVAISKENVVGPEDVRRVDEALDGWRARTQRSRTSLWCRARVSWGRS